MKIDANANGQYDYDYACAKCAAPQAPAEMIVP